MTEEAEKKPIDLDKLKKFVTNKELMTKIFLVLIVSGIVLVYVSGMMLENGAVESAQSVNSLGEMLVWAGVLVIAVVILFTVDDKMPKKKEEVKETPIETDQTVETKEAPE